VDKDRGGSRINTPVGALSLPTHPQTNLSHGLGEGADTGASSSCLSWVCIPRRRRRRLVLLVLEHQHDEVRRFPVPVQVVILDVVGRASCMRERAQVMPPMANQPLCSYLWAGENVHLRGGGGGGGFGAEGAQEEVGQEVESPGERELVWWWRMKSYEMDSVRDGVYVLQEAVSALFMSAPVHAELGGQRRQDGLRARGRGAVALEGHRQPHEEIGDVVRVSVAAGAGLDIAQVRRLVGWMPGPVDAECWMCVSESHIHIHIITR
jgi:hypothetical protein